jgi:hypothetical protein
MHGNRETSEGPAEMFDSRHGREGTSRNPQQSFEESDAFVVPTCKKLAKTRVTPVESMEGRDAANGILAPRDTSRAQDRNDVLSRRRGSEGELLAPSVAPRWEPGAGNPLAGFCPGGGPKGPSLPAPCRVHVSRLIIGHIFLKRSMRAALH